MEAALRESPFLPILGRMCSQEICTNPEFIVKEANRFDLDQGQLGKEIVFLFVFVESSMRHSGNCWFISAVSMITQNATIFERVCPLDQTYDKRFYAGTVPRTLLGREQRILVLFTQAYFIFDSGNLADGSMWWSTITFRPSIID